VARKYTCQRCGAPGHGKDDCGKSRPLSGRLAPALLAGTGESKELTDTVSAAFQAYRNRATRPGISRPSRHWLEDEDFAEVEKDYLAAEELPEGASSDDMAEASDPAGHLAFLEEQVGSKEELLAFAADEFNITELDMEALSEHPDVEIAVAVGRNPSCRGRLYENIRRREDVVEVFDRGLMVRDERINELREYARSDIPVCRLTAAKDPLTPSDALDELAFDENVYIRERVLKNPNATEKQKAIVVMSRPPESDPAWETDEDEL